MPHNLEAYVYMSIAAVILGSSHLFYYFGRLDGLSGVNFYIRLLVWPVYLFIFIGLIAWIKLIFPKEQISNRRLFFVICGLWLMGIVSWFYIMDKLKITF